MAAHSLGSNAPRKSHSWRGFPLRPRIQAASVSSTLRTMVSGATLVRTKKCAKPRTACWEKGVYSAIAFSSPRVTYLLLRTMRRLSHRDCRKAKNASTGRCCRTSGAPCCRSESRPRVRPHGPNRGTRGLREWNRHDPEVVRSHGVGIVPDAHCAAARVRPELAAGPVECQEWFRGTAYAGEAASTPAARAGVRERVHEFRRSDGPCTVATIV